MKKNLKAKAKYLKDVRTIAEAEMRSEGMPCWGVTLDKLLAEEKYEELQIMKEVYEQGRKEK